MHATPSVSRVYGTEWEEDKRNESERFGLTKVLSWHFSGGTKETHRSKGSACTGQELNLAPPKYGAAME